jgi:hypothetical protein
VLRDQEKWLEYITDNPGKQEKHSRLFHMKNIKHRLTAPKEENKFFKNL